MCFLSLDLLLFCNFFNDILCCIKSKSRQILQYSLTLLEQNLSHYSTFLLQITKNIQLQLQLKMKIEIKIKIITNLLLSLLDSSKPFTLFTTEEVWRVNLHIIVQIPCQSTQHRSMKIWQMRDDPSWIAKACLNPATFILGKYLTF